MSLPICRNLARIVRIAGGLDRLAGGPLVVSICGSDELTIEMPARLPENGPARFVLVSWLDYHRAGRSPRRREIAFRVPDVTGRSGWRSGRWVPFAFRTTLHRPSGDSVHTPILGYQRLRALAREWDDFAGDGYVGAAAYDAAFEAFDRRWNERWDDREARRARRDAALARAAAHPRPRDARGRFLKIAS